MDSNNIDDINDINKSITISVLIAIAVLNSILRDLQKKRELYQNNVNNKKYYFDAIINQLFLMGIILYVTWNNYIAYLKDPNETQKKQLASNAFALIAVILELSISYTNYSSSSSS